MQEVDRVLKADQVAYRYVREGHGLPQPVSLSVMPGELVLVTGPSGCGKSTLARCFTGLIPHLYHGSLSGAVWLDDLCTGEANLWQLAEWAGLVFQNPAEQMLAVSVEEEIVFGLENLGCSPDVIQERLATVLARFHLEHLRARAPLTLSGGEQQKVALAAITARQPPLLVLDEPLSMLDSTAAFDLVDHLAELASSGSAVIVCEHRAEYLRGLPNLRTFQLAAPGLTTAALPDHPVPLVRSDPFQLEVTGLSVTLDGRSILKDLNLTLESGQVVAIVGRNGVGKTTLLRALVGLQEHEGTVMVNGSPADLGMVFQNADFQLFNATVRDEILFGLKQSRQQRGTSEQPRQQRGTSEQSRQQRGTNKQPSLELYSWLLAALGLGSYEDAPPLLLSEGEKKRVALATVLMRQPRHGVLLDEPAIGQDEGHKMLLLSLVRQLASAGQLVIITTHDLALAAEADRLMLLGPGGFVADGPPAQVLREDTCWTQLGLRIPPWIRPQGASESAASPVSQKQESAAKLETRDAMEGTEGRAAIRVSLSGKARTLALQTDSPLRRADPRTKLVLALCASLAVMLPLRRLALFLLVYVALLTWARLLPMAARQVWRLKWVLVVLFLVDWLLVSPDLAVIITLRLTLLAGAFTLFFATTTPSELRLALEWLRVPHSYAFSVALAFQSLGLLDDEWRSIRDAQRSRGAWKAFSGWRKLRQQMEDLVALTVPAVVLTVKRSWAMTEAAYARGFDSPKRRPYRRLVLKGLDWILLVLSVGVSLSLLRRW